MNYKKKCGSTDTYLAGTQPNTVTAADRTCHGEIITKSVSVKI